jgi:hypothetical protein
MRRPSWRICSAAETSVAAAKKLQDYGTIGADDVVVCNLTGHGLKQPEVGHLIETKIHADRADARCAACEDQACKLFAVTIHRVSSLNEGNVIRRNMFRRIVCHANRRGRSEIPCCGTFIRTYRLSRGIGEDQRSRLFGDPADFDQVFDRLELGIIG